MTEIILEQEIINDNYTDFIFNNYDIKSNKSVIKNNLVIPDNFNIGLIVGSSGSGKSTLLKQFGDTKEFQWDNKSIISNFTMVTPEKASEVLCAVGLSSVPSWLRPFNCLSNGEQFRANLAMSIATDDKMILMDEFTSVVDRNVAKASSNAFQKYIRKNDKKVILASCHKDIIEWLNPDWIYDTDTNEMITDCHFEKPEIKLELFRCKYDAWNLFKDHHYLTSEMNKSSKGFLATWNGKPVGFVGILAAPNPFFKNGWRVSRLVVLPDYQGLGIGVKLLNYIASLIMTVPDSRVFIRSVHPSIVNACLHGGKWEETSTSGIKRPLLKTGKSREKFTEENGTLYIDDNLRYAYSFKYKGESATTDEAQLFYEKC